MLPQRFSDNCETYTPDPGSCEAAICGYCGSQMAVKRNSSKPLMMYSKTMRSIDFFWCPHREEQWHLQLIKLWDMMDKCASRTLANLLGTEINEILALRKSTRPEKTFVAGF